MRFMLGQDSYTSFFSCALMQLMRPSCVQYLVYLLKAIAICYRFISLKMSEVIENQIDLQTAQSLENESLCYHRHFGTTIPIGIRQDGQPRYILGPHYPLFVATLLITSLLFVIAGCNLASASQHKQIQIYLSVSLTMALYIFSYLRVGLSNPGIASSYKDLNDEQKKNKRHCVPCKIIRPYGTVHCYSCDVCIDGYDHHCPWVGKCIGRENLCSFKLFLLSASIAIGIFAYLSFTADTQPANAQTSANN